MQVGKNPSYRYLLMLISLNFASDEGGKKNLSEIIVTLIHFYLLLC